MLESQVAREIDAYLTGTLGLRNLAQRDHGGRFRRRSTGVGLPDFYGILPNGRWWAVEVKAPDGRKGRREGYEQPKQKAVLDYLRANGALVIVATSVAELHLELSPGRLAQIRAELNPHLYENVAKGHYVPERDEGA